MLLRYPYTLWSFIFYLFIFAGEPSLSGQFCVLPVNTAIQDAFILHCDKYFPQKANPLKISKDPVSMSLKVFGSLLRSKSQMEIRLPMDILEHSSLPME